MATVLAFPSWIWNKGTSPVLTPVSHWCNTTKNVTRISVSWNGKLSKFQKFSHWRCAKCWSLALFRSVSLPALFGSVHTVEPSAPTGKFSTVLFVILALIRVKESKNFLARFHLFMALLTPILCTVSCQNCLFQKNKQKTPPKTKKAHQTNRNSSQLITVILMIFNNFKKYRNSSFRLFLPTTAAYQ